MKQIIYFTTAQDSESFEKSLSQWKVSPNLSNQNFHNKIIRCLSLNNHITVLSSRPINKHFSQQKLNYFEKNDNNITWKYIKAKASKIDKLLFCKNRIHQAFKKSINPDSIIMVDCLNFSLLNSAYQLSKKYNLRTIGIVTDNPNNISFLSSSYKKKLLRIGKKLDSFVCLTKDLNFLYNPLNKPHVEINGVTENIFKEDNQQTEKYFFFGGSLMKEYGLYNLIESFKQSNATDYKLLIAGHHKQQELDSLLDERIVYVGALSYIDNLFLEKHAYCCVNPRPINAEIDKYSFPSKVLEYLAASNLVISTKNPVLQANFNDCIIWSETSSVKDLTDAINRVLKLTKEEIDIIKAKSKKAVESTTSFEYINSKISNLF